MIRFLLIILLTTASLNAVGPQEESRPPLSKDEVLDLLISKMPSAAMVSTIKQAGIAFEPTPEVLEEFRKAGADAAVLAALGESRHAEIPKPLGDREIMMLLAGDAPSENIVRLVQERGIDFQPTADYLAQLQSQGAREVLIATLRKTAPRPLSRDELLQQLRAGADQERLAEKVRQRAIDFEADPQNLEALRTAGAQTPLLEALRTARRAKPFAEQAVAPVLPAAASHPLVAHRPATLICEPSESDVPVFDESGDLGKIIAHLKCREQVTFLEKISSPLGFDRIQFDNGREGLVSNGYLEFAISTPGGDVTAPVAVYKPDAQYTPAARRDRREGKVKLLIVIDTRGNVSDVQEVSPPLGDGLDKSAIDTVKKWRFTPSTRNGISVPVRVNVEMSFRFAQPAR